MSTNDITGDRIVSKTLSKEGRDNWDKIFKSKEKSKEEKDLPFMLKKQAS